MRGKSLVATHHKQDRIKFLYLLTIHYYNWLCEGFQGKVDAGASQEEVPCEPPLVIISSREFGFYLQCK